MANKGKINWENFGFLENLLIHCVHDSREVPAESGVKFRISKVKKEGELCLVFNIDRKNDPLIKDQSVRRPDYLVFYFNEKNKENPCIFTIVEMKGKAHKNLKGGLEQINNLKNRLQKEISEHLSTKFKFKIQGVLLSPYNSDIPRKEIEKEAANGFKILSIQYSHRAELYGYISKLNALSERFVSNDKIRDSEFNFVENLLANKVLTKRKTDKFFTSNFKQSKDREGVYLNYEFEKDGYLAMCANRTKMTLAIKETGESNKAELEKCLENIGISISNNFQIKKIES